MPMKNPSHPGQIVRHACLDALNLTVKVAALVVGVSRQALSNIVNGNAAISADTAIRLEKVFGGIGRIPPGRPVSNLSRMEKPPTG